MASPVDFDVLCSFCEEEFTSGKALMDHLMMCGNKTDPCPNCGKYVRRAIFAYHYENNCANFDEPTTDGEKHKKPQSSNVTPTTMTCPHCNENYDRNTNKNHMKNCHLNPDKRANGQRQTLYPDLDRTSGMQHLDGSGQHNDSDDDVRIPCEWCSQGIPFHLFENHSKACRDQEHKRLEEKSRRTNPSPVPTTPTKPNAALGAIKAFIQYIKCNFCGRPFSSEGHKYHELHCTKNARRNKNS